MELKLPEWASDPPAGFPGAIEPPTGAQQEGFDNGEEPPAGYFNWAFQAVADVQNEVGNAITGTGGTLDGSDLTQLLAAIQRVSVKAALGCLRLAGDTGASQTLRAAARKASTRRIAAVGDNGTIASSNGSTPFTLETPGSAYADDFSDVVFDTTLGLFIAVGAAGEIQSSPDGQAWTRRATGGGDSVLAVASNGAGTLVAVGQTEFLKSSTNGTSWTSRTSPFTGTPHLVSVAFGAGVFVVVTAQNDIATSPDGVTWTVRRATAGATTGRARVVYHSTLGFLYHWSTNVYHSADGITWSTLHTAVPTSSTTVPGLRTAPRCWLIVASSGSGGAYLDGRFSVATANAAADFTLDFVSGSEDIEWLGVLDGQLWALGGDRVFVGGAV